MLEKICESINFRTVVLWTINIWGKKFSYFSLPEGGSGKGGGGSKGVKTHFFDVAEVLLVLEKKFSN